MNGDTCGRTIRLADHDHPHTGIPVDCVLDRGHTGDHYGTTPHFALYWELQVTR